MNIISSVTEIFEWCSFLWRKCKIIGITGLWMYSLIASPFNIKLVYIHKTFLCSVYWYIYQFYSMTFMVVCNHKDILKPIETSFNRRDTKIKMTNFPCCYIDWLKNCVYFGQPETHRNIQTIRDSFYAWSIRVDWNSKISWSFDGILVSKIMPKISFGNR